jgi:hypothetical protein
MEEYESHSAPQTWLLHCPGCHNATCFEHVLDWDIHSSVATKIYEADPRHKLWHEYHKNSHEGFVERKTKLLEAERRGVATSNTEDRLVLAAQRFKYCRPINQVFVDCGWYDRLFQHEVSLAFSMR